MKNNKVAEDNKGSAQIMLQLRKKVGLSQEEFAQKIGVTRQAVSRWEMGISSPNLRTLLQIREVFHLSIDEALDTSDSENEKVRLSGNQKSNKKINIGNVLIELGLIAYLLLPFLAEVKKHKEMELFKNAYEHSYQYISEYPLSIVLILGTLLLVLGCYQKLKRRKYI